MFWWKKQDHKQETNPLNPVQHESHKSMIDFTVPVGDQDEYDRVSVIASAILAGERPDASIRVTSIRKVDSELVVAATVAAAVMAHDAPDSTFRLVSIERGNKKSC